MLSEPVVEQLIRTAPGAEDHAGALVHVNDASVYRLLAEEMVRAALDSDDGGLTVLVDGRTAERANGVAALLKAARHAYVFGPESDAWTHEQGATSCGHVAGIGETDRFLVAFSGTVGMAVLGRRRRARDERDSSFSGGWSTWRGHVEHIGRGLLTAAGIDAHPAFEERACPDASQWASSHGVRLMALVIRHVESLQRDIVKDKNDLVMVLDILKAISAKRRAHDILYVFVQEVARVIESDRCSVVRIWGGKSHGQVLASHEDESVEELSIDLARYPELSRAIAIRDKVVIDDAREDPLTRTVSANLQHAHFTSLVVIPIVLFDPEVGSLFLRAARCQGRFELREVSFCEIVASTAANALERAQLFEGIQEANERLEHLAVTDGLTGLYNHRYFRSRLAEEVARAQRYGAPLSCLIFDVDNFKGFNDTYGHLQGDSILLEIAKRSLATVRRSDVVARYGGEEFVVIMPQTGQEGAKAEAERLQAELSGRSYEGLPAECRVTVSVGVSVMERSATMDCEDLLRVADTALYEAKIQGKNRVVMAALSGEKL